MEDFHRSLRPDLQRGFRPINIDLQESKDYLRLKFKYSYIPNNRKYNLILLSQFYQISNTLLF